MQPADAVYASNWERTEVSTGRALFRTSVQGLAGPAVVPVTCVPRRTSMCEVARWCREEAGNDECLLAKVLLSR